MQAYTLWYTRKNGEVRGPFPRAVITQYLLLNRLNKDDEVSIDQKRWQPIATVEELIPSVLQADLTEPVNQRALEVVKRGADERLAIDRRKKGKAGPGSEKRRGVERRAAEPEDVLKHRRVKTEIIVSARRAQPANTLLAVVIIFAIIGILAAMALSTSPQPEGPDIDCSASPAPGINWTNCSLQGSKFDQRQLQQALIRNADLSGSSLSSANLQEADLAFTNFSLANLKSANLHGAQLMGAKLNGSDLNDADLSNADLSYADLSGADLSGANLSGAKLDQAVWIDKTICARGSVGQCLPGRGR